MRTYYKVKMQSSLAKTEYIKTLFSLELRNDGTVIIIPEPDRRPEINEREDALEDNRISLHYGTISPEYSKINLHRRRRGSEETVSSALSSAIKKGGMQFVVEQMVRMSDEFAVAASLEQHPSEVLFEAQEEAGQLIYRIVVCSTDYEVGVNEDANFFVVENFDEPGGIGHRERHVYFNKIVIGQFKLVVLALQTGLPATFQSYTSAPKTYPPEIFEGDEQKIMKLMMAGSDFGFIVHEFRISAYLAIYNLCNKITKMPFLGGYVAYEIPRIVEADFKRAMKNAYDIIEAAGELWRIDKNYPAPLTSVDVPREVGL